MKKKNKALFESLKNALEEAETFYTSDNETDLIVMDGATLEALDCARKEKGLLDHNKIFRDEQ